MMAGRQVLVILATSYVSPSPPYHLATLPSYDLTILPPYHIAILPSDLTLLTKVLVPYGGTPSPRIRGDGAARPVHDLQKFGDLALA